MQKVTPTITNGLSTIAVSEVFIVDINSPVRISVPVGDIPNQGVATFQLIFESSKDKPAGWEASYDNGTSTFTYKLINFQAPNISGFERPSRIHLGGINYDVYIAATIFGTQAQVTFTLHYVGAL